MTTAGPTLKELALDLVEGRIFSDRHIPKDQGPRAVFMVFMVLSLMKSEDLEKWVKDVDMVYEYLDKAGPRSVNGLPSFFSVHKLLLKDAKEFWGYVKELQEKRAAFLGSDSSKEIAADPEPAA